MEASITKIFPRLYIANYLAIDDEEFFLDHEISHAVLIDEKKGRKWDEIETLELLIGGNPVHNLEKLLDPSFDFIEEGRKEECAVVICCKDKTNAYSASVCTYYIAKKLKISLKDAWETVKEIYPKAKLNPSLADMLKKATGTGKSDSKPPEEPKTVIVTNSMDPVVVTSSQIMETPKVEPNLNPQEKKEDETIKESKTEEISNNNTVATDTLEDKDTIKQTLKPTIHFKCRKCRKTLFTDIDLMLHDEGEGQESFNWRKRTRGFVGSEICTSWFVEPLDWLQEQTLVLDGKIRCMNPKCNEKIGSFRWDGAQCSCGAWLVPAFQILKSRVDKTPLE